MWPLLLATALPPLIEQLGKTARKYLNKRDAKELDALKRRIEALEMRARWI